MTPEEAITRIKRELEEYRLYTDDNLSFFANDIEEILNEIKELTKENAELRERLRGIEEVYHSNSISLVEILLAIKKVCEK